MNRPSQEQERLPPFSILPPGQCRVLSGNLLNTQIKCAVRSFSLQGGCKRMGCFARVDLGEPAEAD